MVGEDTSIIISQSAGLACASSYQCIT